MTIKKAPRKSNAMNERMACKHALLTSANGEVRAGHIKRMARTIEKEYASESPLYVETLKDYINDSNVDVLFNKTCGK